MAREIKFRAWDVPNERFIRKTLMGSFSVWQLDINATGLDYRFQFQQYTGLKDKNGVEIYEGDIVKNHYFNNVLTIQWIGSGLMAYADKDDWSLMEGDNDTNVTKEFEVIGNIHENPELIKE